MLYQFLIIDVDVTVDIIMGEVVAVVEVAMIPGIVIFLVYLKTRNIAPTTKKLNYSKTFGKTTRSNNKQAYETGCYRCRMKGHWLRTYRTAKHLVDLYQVSIKGKGKQIETNFIDGQDTTDCNANFIDGNDAMPLTHLDVSNFYLNFVFIFEDIWILLQTLSIIYHPLEMHALLIVLQLTQFCVIRNNFQI